MDNIVTIDKVNFVWKKLIQRHLEAGKSTSIEVYNCRTCMSEVEVPAESPGPALTEHARSHKEKGARKGLRAV